MSVAAYQRNKVPANNMKRCLSCGKKCETYVEFPKRYICKSCHKTSIKDQPLMPLEFENGDEEPMEDDIDFEDDNLETEPDEE
jgi:nitrate reductase cytochrome c-type subunit